MHPHLKRIQDRAWDIKDLIDELGVRKISERNLAVIEGVGRDLDRLHAKLLAIRDVRKRDKADEPEQPHSNGTDAQPAQQELASNG